MTTAAHIIGIFGGTRTLAAKLSLPPSTVQSWKDSGLIPAKHQQAVLNKARDLGLELSPDDFFESADAQRENAA